MVSFKLRVIFGNTDTEDPERSVTLIMRFSSLLPELILHITRQEGAGLAYLSEKTETISLSAMHIAYHYGLPELLIRNLATNCVRQTFRVRCNTYSQMYCQALRAPRYIALPMVGPCLSLPSCVAAIDTQKISSVNSLRSMTVSL